MGGLWKRKEREDGGELLGSTRCCWRAEPEAKIKRRGWVSRLIEWLNEEGETISELAVCMRCMWACGAVRWSGGALSATRGGRIIAIR